MGDPLLDCSPLISAAASGKLRLVRLLVEGGAQVNGCNPRGETALLAACKALRGEPDGPDTVKLLAYLLQNKADPNAQDRAGRTALMYACMERAGTQVAATLLSAGADPSMEDYSGASALVYAINAQHQPTLKVLMDVCQARGHDIIIIATETGVNGGPVTRRYLNVPPSPDTSPVSCMSPSDIVLKTGSPNSPERENIFNFKGTSRRGSSSSSSQHPSCELSLLGQCSAPRPRQRMLSEPWLCIHSLASLNKAYEEGLRERSQQDERNAEDLGMEGGERENEHREDEESHLHQSKMEETRELYNCYEDLLPRVSQSLVSLIEVCSSQATSSRLIPKRDVAPGASTSDKTIQKSSVDKLPVCPPTHSQLRRNTLPSVMVAPPLIRLPPIVNQSDSHLQVPTQVSCCKSRSMVFLPHPPYSSPPSSSSSTALLVRPLPPLPHTSLASLVAPPATYCSERSKTLLRRHSVQLEEIRVGREEQTNHLDF